MSLGRGRTWVHRSAVVAATIVALVAGTVAQPAAARAAEEPSCRERAGLVTAADGTPYPHAVFTTRNTWRVDTGQVFVQTVYADGELAGGTPESVEADWGDGTRSQAAGVLRCLSYQLNTSARSTFYYAEHSYSAPGTYTVAFGRFGQIAKYVVSDPAPPVADRDGDAVPDDVDRCPDQYGGASPDGCPAVGSEEGDPSATPTFSVEGKTARLTATDITGGADTFRWTVARLDDGEVTHRPTGADVTLTDFDAGIYVVNLQVCRGTEGPCVYKASTDELVIPPDGAFDVSPQPGDALAHTLHARQPPTHGVTYAWSVDGTPLAGTGRDVPWRPTESGSYTVGLTVAVGDVHASTSQRVTIGHSIEVDDSRARPVLNGSVADPHATCDPVQTILTARSTTKVWVAIRASASHTLTVVPRPGTVAATGLLPPDGIATWTGGCFDKDRQTFFVDYDVTDDRALTATAVSGFLTTVTGGAVDPAAVGKAVAELDNVQLWPLTETRASIDELKRVVQGRGDMGVASAHLWRALTTEPEAKRLREFVFAIGAPFPVVGDLTAIAEAATAVWLGDVPDPYEIGRTTDTTAVKGRIELLKAEVPMQEAAVARAQSRRDTRKGTADAVQSTLTVQQRRLDQLLARVHPCPPRVRQCVTEQNALDTKIRQAKAAIKKTTDGPLARVQGNLAEAEAVLQKEKDVLTGLNRAIDGLGKLLGFLTQFTALADLASVVSSGHAIGHVEYRTAASQAP